MGTALQAINDKSRFIFLGSSLICLFCAAALFVGGRPALSAEAPTMKPEPEIIDSPIQAPLPSYAAPIEKVMPSVVFIYAEKSKLVGGKPSFEGGSGIILRADGLILTNRHVIEDAKNVWVTLYDRSTCRAVKVYPDLLLDLAVVKIDADGLVAATIGDSDKLRVGDLVIALGNPLGMAPADGISTASTGIVSKRDCSFVMQGVPYYDMIQTDAAINTGDSGGPLVNLNGEVIGINSAHALFAQNVGFAISMNTARNVFNNLANLGKSTHPLLRITAEDVKPQLTGTTSGTQRRAIITSVEEGSPAEAAGLKSKDIVLRINDREVYAVSEITRALWRMNVGDVIELTCQRGGETVSQTVKLATRPDGKPLAEL